MTSRHRETAEAGTAEVGTAEVAASEVVSATSRTAPAETAEASRLADQLRRAVHGDAWHGPALGELLARVDAETAAARPIAGAHTIWELVRHLAFWQQVVARRAAGEALAPPEADGWSPPTTGGADAAARSWRVDVAALLAGADRLAAQIEELSAAQLDAPAAGRRRPLYAELHGVVQHHLYHAGQIALLVRAQGLGPREPGR